MDAGRNHNLSGETFAAAGAYANAMAAWPEVNHILLDKPGAPLVDACPDDALHELLWIGAVAVAWEVDSMPEDVRQGWLILPQFPSAQDALFDPELGPGAQRTLLILKALVGAVKIELTHVVDQVFRAGERDDRRIVVEGVSHHLAHAFGCNA
ncbi:hypothetical protein D3C72_1955560 [compost metagenome]